MRLALLAVLAVLAAAPARAITGRDAGGSGAQFLQLGAGARALGLGEAMTAAAEGPDAMYWNPAGLARARGPHAAYSRSELPDSVHHDFLAAAVPAEWAHGAFGAAVTRLSQGRIDRRDSLGRDRGSFNPHAEVYALGYAFGWETDREDGRAREYFREAWNLPNASRPYEDEDPWTGLLAAGVSVKAVTETLDRRRETTFAADFGTAFRPAWWPELVLGAALRHLGGRQRFVADTAELPAEAAFGAALDHRVEPEAEEGLTVHGRLMPAAELVLPRYGAPHAKLGLEWEHPFRDRLFGALRLGYSTRPAVTLGPLAGLTGGVGLRAGPLSVDFAFQPLGALGQHLRIGTEWRF